MIRLLQQPRSAGYPTDFLLARLRGKRQHLAESRSAGGSDNRWSDLQDDFQTVFAAMEKGLRRRFAPCFLYFELRNLQMILRTVSSHDQQQLEQLGRHSLLQRRLLAQLQQSEESVDAFAVIDRWLSPLIPGWEPLAEIYTQHGFRPAEEKLTETVLRHFADSRLTPEMTSFITGLIDMRNLLAAARCLRWELDVLSLVNGGSQINRQLEMAMRKDGVNGLKQILEHQVSEGVEDLAHLERVLQLRISRQLASLARDPLGFGLILDYLWQRYQAFRSSGLSFWAGEEVGAWEAPL